MKLIHKFGSARFLTVGRLFAYWGSRGVSVTYGDWVIFTSEKGKP